MKNLVLQVHLLGDVNQNVISINSYQVRNEMKLVHALYVHYSSWYRDIAELVQNLAYKPQLMGDLRQKIISSNLYQRLTKYKFVFDSVHQFLR